MRREAMITVLPRSLKLSMSARPIPVAPPVMRIVLPLAGRGSRLTVGAACTGAVCANDGVV